MKWVNRFKTHPDQAGIPSEDVVFYRLADGAELFTVATDADGICTVEREGNPGPFRAVMTYNGETREVYGNMSEQHGNLYSGEMGELLGFFDEGVLRGLEVSASSGMDVSIAEGIAFGQNNMHSSYAAVTKTIAANSSGNPRIDIVGIEIANGDHTYPWQTQSVVVQGTPAASPVAPTYSETNRILVPLAYVAVGDGVSSIVSDNITDQRTFSAPTISDNSITLAKLAASGALEGDTIEFDGSDWITVTPASSSQTEGIVLPASGGTSVIPAGVPDAGVYVPYTFTITAWRGGAKESGSCSAALQYATVDNYPTFGTISGSAPMTISSAYKGNGSATGWLAGPYSGGWLRLNFTGAATSIKNVSFTLTVTKGA